MADIRITAELTSGLRILPLVGMLGLVWPQPGPAQGRSDPISLAAAGPLRGAVPPGAMGSGSDRIGAGLAAGDDIHLDSSLLLLEVIIDNFSISDTLNTYQSGSDLLLPLGELARLLTLAIRVSPDMSGASGFILSEERGFGLNMANRVVSIAGKGSVFAPGLLKVIGDDIYVPSRLLSQWWPVDFDVQLQSLQLKVTPRERLPLQARIERERTLSALRRPMGADMPDPGYPRVITPHRLIDRPFIDQTFGTDARRGRTSQQYRNTYTAYATADILGMEGAAYISSTRDKPEPDYRITLGRNDPDGRLLGPLGARSFVMGDIVLPSVANIMTTAPIGSGLAFSNRRLDQPTSFDRQSLRGELPPGWDVTLYYNDALIAFQQSRGDGLYAFDDLPLSFGRNDFLLVFNGPLGQVRTERRSFLIDQSIVKPGEFLYSFAHSHPSEGNSRSVARFDLGLNKELVASGGLIMMPRPLFSGAGLREDRQYGQIGLRGYWDSFILTSELVNASSGGNLTELGMKTRISNYSLDLLRTDVQRGFDSDVFAASSDPIRRRERLRLLGTINPKGPRRLPVALEAQRDTAHSGNTVDTATGRISALLSGTFVTNSVSLLRYSSQGLGSAITDRTTGNLQLSRRVAGFGLAGQIGYSIRPHYRTELMTLTADRMLRDGYRINAAVLRDMLTDTTLISAGQSRSFGKFALALSGSYSNRHELVVGLQFFMALGHDPRGGRWFAESLPMASAGAVSARAFVDRNMNGIRDADEELIQNAGFIVNSGGRHPMRTGEDGTLMINRLPTGRFADIALDPATLEDPQWKPAVSGARVLPRPGFVQSVEFPVASTADIDGIVYLNDDRGRRGVGDARVELVDAQGKVAAIVVSASDGSYTLPQVLPGRYLVRISPSQLNKLGLGSGGAREVIVGPQSDFISGVDLEARKLAP